MFPGSKLPDVYRTGLRAIDRQHQVLIHQIGAVMRMLSSPSTALQADALTKLLVLTEAHFAYEEGEMEAIADAHIDGHRAAHHRLLSTLQKMVDRTRAGRPASVDDGPFFQSWLSSHILGVDMRYVPRMVEEGRGTFESAEVTVKLTDPGGVE